MSASWSSSRRPPASAPGRRTTCPSSVAVGLEGLVWATGHYRNGILLAPLTAEAVIAAIVDGDRAPLGAETAPDRFEQTPAERGALAGAAGRPA